MILNRSSFVLLFGTLWVSSVYAAGKSGGGNTTEEPTNLCEFIEPAPLDGDPGIGRTFIASIAVQGEGEESSECGLFSTTEECVDVALTVSTNSTSGDPETYTIAFLMFNTTAERYTEVVTEMVRISEDKSLYNATSEDGEEFTFLRAVSDDRSYSVVVICNGEVSKYYVTVRDPNFPEETVQAAIGNLTEAYNGPEELTFEDGDSSLNDYTGLAPADPEA